jgi:hypothetical protein
MFRSTAAWVHELKSGDLQPKTWIVALITLLVCWFVFLICVGVSIWMQFAVQKSAYIPAWLCYMVMGVCAVGFGVTAHRLVFRSVKE